MAFSVDLAPRAEADFASLIAYVAQDSPEAAGRFGRELRSRIAKLAENPYLGIASSKRQGVRRLVHRPYLVLYRVDTEVGKIEVLRIWHGARNPDSLHL